MSRALPGEAANSLSATALVAAVDLSVSLRQSGVLRAQGQDKPACTLLEKFGERPESKVWLRMKVQPRGRVLLE